MLRVRRDKQAANGATQIDKTPAAEHALTGVQPADRPPLSDDLYFGQVAAILRRRSSLILAIAAVGTLLAVAVGLLIPPKYTAMAHLVVDVPVSATDRAPSVLEIYESIDTHVALLSSRDHLRRVVESLAQDSAPGPETRHTVDAAPLDRSGRDASRLTAADQPTTNVITEFERRVRVWLGELGRSGNATVPHLEQFMRNTRVIQERRSRVITVGFTSTDPNKAAASANRIVQLYVDGLSEQKQAFANREMAQLDERIAEARNEAKKAEAAAQTAIQQKSSTEQNASTGERTTDGQLRELLRHAGSTAQHYDSLLRSRKELRERQAGSSGAEIQMLPAEAPDRPSSHNPIFFIIPALIVFAIGGSWLAVVLERLDRGLRSQQETADALGIPCVGLVPLLRRKHAIRPEQYLLAEPFSAYAEAIRSALAALAPARTSKVILVCSSIPGEGKTTLARSLAAYAGFLGRNVLLIDLDLRPGPQPDERDDTGPIVDLFAQSHQPIELIRSIADVRFDYLPMAAYRPDPLALIASEQMPGLVRNLRERYDCVIIDGPSVLGAVEARLLPSIADKLLLVVKWGSTRREVSQNALSLLRQSGCLGTARSDFAMAVVTQVDLRQHARYRFGDVGEFMDVSRGTQRREADTGNQRKPPHERLSAQQTHPKASDKPEGLQTDQSCRPKASGDEADGRSV